MVVCSVGDHVWVAENGQLREMVVKKIFDEVNAVNPLYELEQVGGGFFDYKLLHAEDFFLYKDSAIDVALKQADTIIDKGNKDIAMAKCEIRYAKRCKKQLEKAAKELE